MCGCVRRISLGRYRRCAAARKATLVVAADHMGPSMRRRLGGVE
jgi:hypothetical protein